VDAPWSIEKFLNLLSHLWIPMVILGTAGTAGLIRTLRANLLDELRRPYVTTARTKGLPEFWLLIKYPLRHALNPFVSGLNDVFVGLVSGETIVAIVLSLQTTGPLLLDALRTQDMYLAGSFILMLSLLAVFGTLFSDLLLAWLDPRIRFR
jgi:peptide/nickel transport system permease protein